MSFKSPKGTLEKMLAAKSKDQKEWQFRMTAVVCAGSNDVEGCCLANNQLEQYLESRKIN